MRDIIKILKENVIEPVESLIENHDAKRVWLDGIKTVIVGRVNAGKSSLLNRLLEEQRAIVTPIPGTTRDVIEATITIEGIPLLLMDTAGLRNVKDEVEKIGVNLTSEKIAEADLLLLVIDQSIPLDRDDLKLIKQCAVRRALIILNKMDLPQCLQSEKVATLASGCPVVRISALTGEGLGNLKKAIVESVMGGKLDPVSSQAVTNLRHKEALTSADGYFKAAVKKLEERAPLEIVALELKCGLESVEEITGASASDELLERIFGQFCLGK